MTKEYEAYKAQALTLDEFEGTRYQRIGHIHKLIGDGILDTSLRHQVKRVASVTDAFRSDAAQVHCISCDHHGLEPILDLGLMPRSDGLGVGKQGQQRLRVSCGCQDAV